MNDVQAAIREAIGQRPDLPEPATRKALRQRAGLTQDTVARIVGVSRPMVTLYEAGSREPSGEHRRRYAEALKAMQV